MQFRGDTVPLTRRELCLAFPVALLPALHLVQDTSSAAQGALPSSVYPFGNLVVRTVNNAQFRDVLKGKLATGESLEVHETTLPPGGAPHPPHHHVHSEMWLIREGTVELAVNGKTYRLEPGSVGFVHSNDEHGIKNVGATPATYFVVAIGPGADS
jgi:quercetin dioxygenase-like cupin family protein